MINPNTELFKWGAIDGRPIYVNFFVDAFIEYPNYSEGTWPDTIGFFEDDSIVFVIDDKELRDNAEFIFKKYILGEDIQKYFDEWMDTVKKIKKFEKLVNKQVPKIELFIELGKLYVDFWVKGFLPELSNWGGERMLKNKVIEFDKDNSIEIIEALTAPEDYSFYQIEELELMKIKLIKNKKKQLEELKEHQEKYYWMNNNYAFTEVLGIDYFKEQLEKISEQDARNKIKEIEDYIKDVKNKKKEVIKKYNVPEDIIEIADKLAYNVWWQDFRKQFVFIANHIITKFLEKISKEKNIDFKALCYYNPDEIVDLIKNDKEVDVEKRYNGFIAYYHERKKATYLEGKEAKEFIKPYIEVKINKNLKEIKGIVVSKGDIIKGKVKVISSKTKDKMEKGDILVTSMTSPDFIFAMRKASAIITDEGGMTCHAAIVSRELKIPCIVATRIATKVFKDGDVVEVDADKGVVRKL